MATLFRKILCPIDFSQNSLKALDQAAKLARKHDAQLYLMNVEFVPMSNPDELAHYVTVSTEPLKLRLEKIARKHLIKVRHEVVVRVGWPADVIEKAAEDFAIDLIVLATHSRTGMTRLFLGSVAESVVRASKRSVLSFGPGTTLGMMKRILCPVAFEPNSVSAVNFARRLAQQYRAAIILFHVVSLPFEPSEVPQEILIPEWEEEALAQLKKMADENLGNQATCELVARRGDPATEILEVANDLRPDLIVMATHGRTGLSHFVLGGVAGRTVRESTVPVLTVRGEHTIVSQT
jgi:nucleotide-binding universal stress UspA family protein